MTGPVAGARSIKANFAWNIAGKMAFALARAAVLVLLAKLGSPVMVGQYALALAITTPVFYLTDLDLRSVLATDVHNPRPFGQYLALRLLTTAGALLICGALAILQQDSAISGAILLLGLAKGSETLSDIFFGLMQKHGRLDQTGRSLIVRSILTVLIPGILLLLKQPLAIVLAGLVLAWLLVLLFHDWPASRRHAMLKPRFQPADLISLLRLSLPLGLVLLIGALNKNIPNYFIQHWLGSEYLGYFAALVYLMANGTILTGALGQAANTRLAGCHAAGDIKQFNRIWLRLAGLTLAAGTAMVLASLLLGRQMLTLLYTPAYANYAGILNWIMLAAAFGGIGEITGYALTAARLFRIQPFIQLAALLTGLSLNAWLVPRYGLDGAAWSLLAGTLVQMAGSMLILGKCLDWPGRLLSAVRGRRRLSSGSRLP